MHKAQNTPTRSDSRRRSSPRLSLCSCKSCASLYDPALVLGRETREDGHGKRMRLANRSDSMRLFAVRLVRPRQTARRGSAWERRGEISAGVNADSNGSSRWSREFGASGYPALSLRLRVVLRELGWRRALDMEVCTTLGMLSPEQARQLKAAGLTAYNHNLDTSREYYPKVRFF